VPAVSLPARTLARSTSAAPATPGISSASTAARSASTPKDGDGQELPKRRRGQTLAAASKPVTPPKPAPARPRAADAGSRFGAFRRASRRDDTGTDASAPPSVPTAGPDKTIGS
jgi:hypothetical protein